MLNNKIFFKKKNVRKNKRKPKLTQQPTTRNMRSS